MITTLAAGRRWRKRASPVARKAFNIIFNYRHYGAGIARNVAQRNGGQRCSGWQVRIIAIMLFAVAERGLHISKIYKIKSLNFIKLIY